MLESYIAPLLMGYVDKYVLNLKPSDLSLSVWGGDVVLHNLELNLPLLQKELNLPIHFLSGKIYKLQIHVPWTKLIYEPVTITINTMEFIVTLKESSSDTSTNDAQEESESHVQPPPPINDDNLPPGYVQSILNKVINNVAFKIENIILKYVEDDIVFSVNVKSVELFSADSSWNRAFTELTLPELVLRKICNLTDVTICLDQQSSNGRIDVYQDPILYKSSLTCRILSKYNSLKGIKTESINFDVFCESLDFSITDQQIPLLLRLLLLAKGLFYGTLDLPGCEFRKHSGTSIVMEEKRRVEGFKNMSVESNESLDTSWTAWAWSLIPGQDDPSNYTGKPSKPETKHFRAYIAQLTLILKKTTQMSNTVTSQRLEFTPILCTEISGFMVEFISIGQHLIDLRCGIQKLVGYSFGNQCVCTVISEDLNEDQEASNNVNNIQDEVFVSIGDDSMLHQPKFLQKSLFAEQDNIENEKPALNSSSSIILEEPSMENSFLAVESGDIEIKVIANDSKVESSDYLLKNELTHENYGSIFCSYFYEMEIPENKSPNEIENIFLYPERDDKVNEISSKNLAIAHCDIFITTSLKHIVDWLIEVMLADMPKRKEKTEIFLDPFCMQQLEIGNFLSSTLNVNVSDIQIFLLANDHFTGMFTDNQVNETKQDGLMLRIEQLNVLRTDPMYPIELSYLHENQRLVKLHKVANLQTKINIKVTGCEFGFSVVDRSSLSKNNQLILQPLNLNLEISLPIQTLRKHHSRHDFIQVRLVCEEVLLAFQKVHPILCFNLLATWVSNSSIKNTLKFHQLCTERLQSDGDWIKINIGKIDFLSIFNKDFIGVSGSIESFITKISKQVEDDGYLIVEAPCNTVDLVDDKNWTNRNALNEKPKKFVTLKSQLSVKSEGAAEMIQLVKLDVCGSVVNIDQQLHDWLSHVVSVEPMKSPVKVATHENKKELSRSVSSTPGRFKSYAKMFGTGSNKSLSASSKEKEKPKQEEKVVENKNQIRFGDWFIQHMTAMKEIHLKIHIDPLVSVVSNDMELKCHHTKGIVVSVQELKNNNMLPKAVVLCLPSVEIESSKGDASIFNQPLPILNTIEDSLIETLPWTVSCKNFTILTLMNEAHVSYQNHSYLCKPISWSILLASVNEKSLKKYTSDLETIEENGKWESGENGETKKFSSHGELSHSKSEAGFVLHMHCSVFEWMFSKEQVDLMFEIVKKSALTCDQLLYNMKKIKRANNIRSKEKLEQAIKTDDVFSVSSSSSIDQIDVNSTITDSSSIFPKAKHESDHAISLWLQCTIPKIKVTIFTPLDAQSMVYKLSSEIEEIMFSFDYQDNVVNVTNKVAACAVAYSLIRLDNMPTGWITLDKGYLLCQKELPHDSTQARTFLTVNYTRTHHQVSCLVANRPQTPECDISTNLSSIKNAFDVHEELFIKQELSIQILSFDLFVNLKPLLACLQVFKNISLSDILISDRSKNLTNKNSSMLNKPMELSVVVFPRIAVIIECFRVFVPREKNLNANENAIDNDESNFLFNINSITLGSTPENPLTKTVLNKQVYRQIKQVYKEPLKKLKLWNIQYQLCITNASLCTTNWYAFEDSLPERDIVVQHNPALAWNQKDRFSQPLITPIFPGFDVKLTFAPPVIAKAQGTDFLPVTGAALEVHSPKEVRIYLNTLQVKLLEEHLSDAYLMCQEILSIFVSNSSRKEDIMEKVPVQQDIISIESFASVSDISIFFSHKEKDSNNLLWITYPLFHCDIKQPTLSINTCKDKHLFLNILDLQIKGSAKACKDFVPLPHDFDMNVLVCDSNNSPSLPPMFFKLEIRFDKELECHVNASLGQRFICFYDVCLQNNILKHYTEIKNAFIKMLDFFSPSTHAKESENNDLDNIQPQENSTFAESLLIVVSGLTLQTNSIGICMLTSKNTRFHFNVDSINCCMNLHDKTAQALCISGAAQNVHSYLAGDFGRLNILCPMILNYSVDIEADKYRNIQSNISLDIGHVKLKLSKSLLQKIMLVGEEISSHMKSLSKVFVSQEEISVASVDKHAPIVLLESKDDLRSGLLDYIVVDDGEKLPELNCIYFYESGETQDGCMVWRYSEPRQITALHVVPVPFHLNEEARLFLQERFSGKISCCLQYYNSLTKTYDYVANFDVSESETFYVEMNNCAVSSTWKVTVNVPKQILSLNKSEFPVLPTTSLGACIALDSRVLQKSQFNLKMNVDELLLCLSSSSKRFSTQTSFDSYLIDSNALYDASQVISKVIFKNNNLEMYSRNFDMSLMKFDTNIDVKLLDFNDYMWIDFIRSFQAKTTIRWDSSKVCLNEKCVVDIIVGDIKVNILQATLHGIHALITEWNSEDIEDRTVFQHYLICNETQDTISLKQQNTEECVVLRSGCFYPYSWYATDNQSLYFSVGSSQQLVGPININKNGVSVHVIEESQFSYQVYVDIKEINSLQKQIEFHGCCVFENKLPVGLEVDIVWQESFLTSCKVMKNADFIQKIVSSPFIIPGNLCWPSQCLNHSFMRGIKLKLEDSSVNGRAFVSHFPEMLDETKMLATLQKDLIHCWITTMYSNQLPGQLNIRILPPLVVRNHMLDMVQLEFYSVSRETSAQRSVEIPGKHGREQILFVHPNEKYNMKVTLPRTSVSFIAFYDLQFYNDIDLQLFHFPQLVGWPFKTDIEKPFQQSPENPVTLTSTTPCAHNTSMYLLVSKDEEHSHSVNIDLFPPYILMNESQLDLSVETEEWGNSVVLAAQSQLSSVFIKTRFKLGCEFDMSSKSWSKFITLDESELSSNILNISSHLNIMIEGTKKICCHLVVSREKVGLTNILKFQERFKIHNLSSHVINVFPITSSGDQEHTVGKELSSLSIPKESAVVCSMFNLTREETSKDVDLNILVGVKLEDSVGSKLAEVEDGNTVSRNVVEANEDGNTVSRNVVEANEDESGYESTNVLLKERNHLNKQSNVVFQKDELLNLSEDHFREFLRSKCNDSVVTIVATSLLSDGVINIFMDVEKFHLFKIHNDLNTTLGMLPVEKYAGPVFNNFEVLLKDHTKLYVIKHSEETLITSKMFYNNFPKLNNNIQISCQLCILCKDTIELSNPVLLENGLKNKKVFVPGFGEIFITCVLHDSQLCITLSESSHEEPLILTKACNFPKLQFSVSSLYTLFINEEYNKPLQPLLSVVLSGIKTRHTVLNNKSFLTFSIADFRIENQMNDKIYHFPVVLLPLRQVKDRYKTLFEDMPFADQRTEEVTDHLIFTCSVVEDNFGKHCIEEVELTFQPSELYVEDTFIYECYSAFKSFATIIPKTLMRCDDQNKKCLDDGKSILYPIKVCKFSINEVSVLVSFHVSLKMYLAANHIPLVFAQFQSKPTLSVSKEIYRALLYHYATQTLVSTGWIIGSFEILGNPTGLLHNVGRGLSDVFGYPYQGIIRGPSAFVSGISHGVSSFLKHISKGALLSINNVSSSLSRNIELLSFDELHQSIQEELRVNRATNASQGFNNALQSFGLSLLGAVAGIVDHPIQNATNAETTRDAVMGIISGLAKGVVGVVTKPVGGAMEFISQTSHNILQTSGLVNYPKKLHIVDPELGRLVVKTMSQYKVERQWSKIIDDTECLFINDAQLANTNDINKAIPCYILISPTMLFIYKENTSKLVLPVSELICSNVDDCSIIKITRVSETQKHDVLDTNPNIQYYFESFEQASVSCHNESLCHSNLTGKGECWFLFMDPIMCELFLLFVSAGVSI